MGDIADDMLDQAFDDPDGNIYGDGDLYGEDNQELYWAAQRPVTYHWVRDIQVIHETEKAWLIKLTVDRQECEEWFPKSRCQLSKSKRSIRCPGWLLERKDLI